MSDQLKHECGISLIHLKKPLDFYTQKYGSHMYGVDKMFLMMEKLLITLAMKNQWRKKLKNFQIKILKDTLN